MNLRPTIMKTKTIALIGTLLFAINLASGQDLQENLDFLQQHIVTVSDNKIEYNQTFSFDPVDKHIISITTVESRRGKIRIETVNARDLNPHLIKFSPTKTTVEITAITNGKNNLVKVEEDGEIQNYTSQVLLRATGVEEARAITDALKKVVEIVNKDDDLLPKISEDKPSLLNDVAMHIQDVVINNNNFVQTFSYNEENTNIATIRFTDVSRGDTEEYTFNLADVNPHQISFTTRRKEVFLPVNIKGNNNLIAYSKNQELGNYSNAFQIKAPSIEVARNLEAHLKALVLLAEKEVGKDYSSLSAEACVQILSEKISEVLINADAYQQSFAIDKDNPMIFNYSIQDMSKGLKKEYTANSADFGKLPAVFKTHRNSVFVELKVVGGRNLIRDSEEGGRLQYTSALQITMPDVETAREVAAVFSRWNTLSLETMERMIAFSSVEEAERFVIENVDQVVINTDTYTQSFKRNDGGDCLMSYHLTDVSKGTHFDYEFNLKDVDAHKVLFNTRRSEAFVNLEIKGSNNLVKSYKDGEVQRYISSFQIKAKDVEEGRKLESALKMMALSCEEK
jgi:hypothetical protein